MNKKSGLEYFPFDIDFFQDDKIQFISARFGTKGEAITVRLLCKIYRQGYYIDWNDDIALLFAKSVGDGCQHSCVKDVVFELLKRGFFDRSIFERFSILTSKGIQRRYLEASVRRKGIEINNDFLLIDTSKYENVNITAQNVYILDENDDILRQSKVNEKKRKESKVKDAKNILADDFFSTSMRGKINEWLDYKNERREYYKPTGLRNLLSQIENKLKLYTEDQVITLISECMASNYKGIIWDKIKGQERSDKQNTSETNPYETEGDY